LQSDLNIYRLPDELLLDFEPGLTETIIERLEKYVIADDVQMTDVGPLYGLLSVQGPKAEEAVRLCLRTENEQTATSPRPSPPLRGGEGEERAGGSLPPAETEIPAKLMSFSTINDATLGEIYVMNRPRTGSGGFDLFVPVVSLGAVMDKLVAAAKQAGGRACGWQAMEMARIEAGIPRFGVDMDESNLAPEAGIESRAISYAKGCYIGQEVIARIRTHGNVGKTLRRLRLADDLKELPRKGDKLYRDGKEAGYITSAVASPALKANIALGYVRKEANQAGTELILRKADGESVVKVGEAP
jgi:folate-binding protein YgfZ